MKNLLFACAILFTMLMSGCSSTSRSIKFSQQDVKLIPAVSMHKVLTPGSSNQLVVIRARTLPDLAIVEGFEGEDKVVARDEEGKASTVSFGEITDIYRVTHYNRENESTGSGKGSAAAAVGETLIYVPLIPVAVVSWPFLRAMGLDEHKNANDREKALVIYGSMTKQDLRQAIGEPDKRYRCVSKSSPKGFDVWNYAKERVLTGGQFLFFSDKDGEVFFSSSRYPGWAECKTSEP